MTAEQSVLRMRHLRPREYVEMQFSKTRQTSMPHGSLMTAIKRPSRFPDFSRPYQAGDPVRLIDWRAFAKFDSLIVREERDDAPSDVIVSLDTSREMDWPPKSHPMFKGACTKIELAWRLSWTLLYIHRKVGDQCFYHVMPGHQRLYEVRSLLEVDQEFSELEKTDFVFSDHSAKLSMRRTTHSPFRTRYLVTDGLNQPAVEQFLESSGMKVLFLINSHYETNLQWLKSNVCLFDDVKDRKEYLGEELVQQNFFVNEFRRWQSKLVERASKAGVHVFSFDDESPLHYFSEALKSFMHTEP